MWTHGWKTYTLVCICLHNFFFLLLVCREKPLSENVGRGGKSLHKSCTKAGWLRFQSLKSSSSILPSSNLKCFQSVLRLKCDQTRKQLLLAALKRPGGNERGNTGSYRKPSCGRQRGRCCSRTSNSWCIPLPRLHRRCPIKVPNF